MEEVHKVGVACPTCKKTFVFINDMKKHKRTVHASSTHSCNVCEAVFQTKQGLTDHRQRRCRTRTPPARQTTEVSAAELKCHHCEYKTPNQDHFISHVSNHSNSTNYSCKTCKEQFNEKSRLINHQVTHHCTCSYCKSSFDTFEQIEKHICSMHAFMTIPEQRRRLRRMNTECTSGQFCEHYKKGRCWFKHSLVINHSQQEGQENQRWCKYQGRCDRRQTCSFRHYDEGGPAVQAELGGQGGLQGVGQGGLAGQGGREGQTGLAGQGGRADQAPVAQAELSKKQALPHRWGNYHACEICGHTHICVLILKGVWT